MALFSDDEDYQDDQGQNQQPLNTLDHIDSSRNLYNNIKISRAVVRPEAQDRRRRPRAVPLIHQERLLLHHKESHRRQAKRPSKLRAVPPKNPALRPGASSGNLCDCRRSAASIPILIIIAIVIGIILLIFFLIGVLADLTSFSPFDTATSYIEEAKKKGINDIKSFFWKVFAVI